MHAQEHTESPWWIKGRREPNGALQVWFQQPICQKRHSINAGSLWADMTAYLCLCVRICVLLWTFEEEHVFMPG